MSKQWEGAAGTWQKINKDGMLEFVHRRLARFPSPLVLEATTGNRQLLPPNPLYFERREITNLGCLFAERNTPSPDVPVEPTWGREAGVLIWRVPVGAKPRLGPPRCTSCLKAARSMALDLRLSFEAPFSLGHAQRHICLLRFLAGCRESDRRHRPVALLFLAIL